MSKLELKNRAFVAPTPTVIVSAYDESGKTDACTLAFFMVSSHVPPCVTIAINATAKRKTLKSILSSKAFVVGFPSTKQITEADYIGLESGYNADKLGNATFTTTKAESVNAPIINEIALSLECELVSELTVGSHTQLTGEIKRIVAEESIVNEKGRVVLEKLDPIIYDEEEFVYFGLGERKAAAFKTGAQFRKELTERQEDTGKA